MMESEKSSKFTLKKLKWFGTNYGKGAISSLATFQVDEKTKRQTDGWTNIQVGG